jgi:diguanylate cyclase (GGDEF)-like protein
MRRSALRVLPLAAVAGGAAATAVVAGLAGSWDAAAAAAVAAGAGLAAWWTAGGVMADQGSTTVTLALNPQQLAARRQVLYDDLTRLEDAQDLQNGVFEVGSELVGCVDEADARHRFAAAMRRYWSFRAIDLWVWERGSWHCIGDADRKDPPAMPERPVQLPDEAGGELILDLSTAVTGQAVLVVHGAVEQPSLVGRSSDDRRWVAEVLRSQLALSLRRVLLYADLNALARIDPLTGTHRRWYGESRLAELVEAGQMLSVAMIDIDHFKTVNDEHGHAAGDQVLAAVGRALTAQLRLGDLVCRFGGEEFLVILPETPPAGALHVASRLRSAVAELTGLPRPVTVSVGLASCHQDETAPNLVARADEAMYRAKAAGRDRVVVADEVGDPRLRTVSRKRRKPGESSSGKRGTVGE